VNYTPCKTEAAMDSREAEGLVIRAIRRSPRQFVAVFALRADQRTNFLPANDFSDVPALIEIENDNGEIIVFAE
jgi:hypothetical protein